MKREFSAGGIVFNEKNEVLLVKNYNPERKVDYWGFPKGHIEKKESGKEAAIREVKEETGVYAEVIQKLGDIKYFFYCSNEKVFKNVAVFLMESKEGEVVHQESELAEAGWFETKVALTLITFKNDKEMFKIALTLKGV